MAVDLSSLVGRRLHSVRKKGCTWFFVFDDESHVDTESPWRLLMDRVVVSSEDHGHQFGLPVPVDAADVVRGNVNDSPVNRVELDSRTGDLAFLFQNGIVLQFLTLSGGYEGWRMSRRSQRIICTGGGELAILDTGTEREHGTP